jgi:hypothetical protein
VSQRCFVPMGEGMKLQKYLKSVKLLSDGSNYTQSKLENKEFFYAFCKFFLLYECHNSIIPTTISGAERTMPMVSQLNAK